MNKNRNNGHAERNGIPEFLGSGRKSWTLDAGSWTLDAGLWTLGSTGSEQNQNPVSDSF